MILAIDPGNTESGVVVLDENLEPTAKAKIDNKILLGNIVNGDLNGIKYVAIEMVACYGMAVGKSVFDTCVWIGRYSQAIKEHLGIEPTYIYRKDEKINLCNSMKAKDSNIIQALVDRFAPNTPNKGKGTKKEPGWFYGFKKDIWQAYAVGVTYHDMYLKEDK
ncbi:hypothetical protein FC959_16945 [Clostridium botulinum]|nr:hypothetical protein [Clostridium botulinum]